MLSETRGLIDNWPPWLPSLTQPRRGPVRRRCSSCYVCHTFSTAAEKLHTPSSYSHDASQLVRLASSDVKPTNVSQLLPAKPRGRRRLAGQHVGCSISYRACRIWRSTRMVWSVSRYTGNVGRGSACRGVHIAGRRSRVRIGE